MTSGYVCNKREPGCVCRCSHEHGHKGDHRDGTPPQHTWPNLSEPKAKAQRKRSRLPRTSQAQSDRTDALTGIMAERINQSIAFTGVFACECYLAGREGCGRTWSTRQKALDECDPHHLNRRRGRPGSKRADFFSSDDAPVGIAVVSKVCHREIESNVQFTKGATG